MVSKELLSEVLGILYNIKNIDLVCNTVNWESGNPGKFPVQGFINIYELANKCKEWASDYMYKLSSHKDVYDTKDRWYSELENGEKDIFINFRATTEPEAIFTACQWILDNKDSSEAN